MSDFPDDRELRKSAAPLIDAVTAVKNGVLIGTTWEGPLK